MPRIRQVQDFLVHSAVITTLLFQPQKLQVFFQGPSSKSTAPPCKITFSAIWNCLGVAKIPNLFEHVTGGVILFVATSAPLTILFWVLGKALVYLVHNGEKNVLLAPSTSLTETAVILCLSLRIETAIFMTKISRRLVSEEDGSDCANRYRTPRSCACV